MKAALFFSLSLSAFPLGCEYSILKIRPGDLDSRWKVYNAQFFKRAPVDLHYPIQ